MRHTSRNLRLQNEFTASRTITPTQIGPGGLCYTDDWRGHVKLMPVSGASHLSRLRTACQNVGEWLSLVEHLVRDQGVGGSNPLSPTNFSLAYSALYIAFARFFGTFGTIETR